MEIVGTEAAVRVPNMWIPDDRAAFQVVRQKGDVRRRTVETVETPGENQMVHMLDDFAAAVRGEAGAVPEPGRGGEDAAGAGRAGEVGPGGAGSGGVGMSAVTP